jgi:MerR family transcriptional regulator, copper efflux regulator
MKSSGAATMTIGQLAGRFGLATHVLRHWESVGLLAPARLAGQRRYSEADAAQVSFILLGKQFGFGLQDLRELLGIHDIASRNAALRHYKKLLEHRIALAQEQLALIDHGLTCPVADYHDCPHIHELLAERVPATAPRADVPPAGG